MTTGPPRKVLAEVASEINRYESGELTLTWDTAHGHRVLDVSPTSVRLAAAPAAEQAVQPDQVRKQEPTVQPASSIWEYWGLAWRNVWETLFPPRGSGR